MSAAFDQACDRVLGFEDGYVNNPLDPGGETKWGVCKRSYPDVDILHLTREGAIAIFHRDFWLPLDGDRLQRVVMYQVFDFAVNSSITTSIRYLQRAIGVADDGYWGPVSEHAATAMAVSDVLLGLNAERLDYMTRLKNWDNAGRGWARRIAQNLRYGAIDT